LASCDLPTSPPPLRESRPRLIPPAANLGASLVTPALGSLFAGSPQASSKSKSCLVPGGISVNSESIALKSSPMDDESRISYVGSTDNSLDTQTGDTKKRKEMQPRFGVWAHFDK
ncbi:hypothetical protein HAX54_012949, partial [Datura stramonium]|nr:hypothetical protein [Datura stramonium]